jgi:RimJ/RimL family protein N-acetyltransferase
LETARLRLRPASPEDFDVKAAMLSDAETVRYLGGTALSREETWRKLLIGPALWAWLGYGYWSVERKSDGRLIGELGFADFKRDMTPSIEGLPEMGWVFASDVVGQGYASEGVAAALAWIDGALAPPQIVAIIDPDNRASIRLAEAQGFMKDGPATYRGEPILLLRRKI